MANYLDKIINATVSAVLSKADNGKIFGEYYKRTDAASKLDWTKQPTNFTSKTIDDWVTAVMAATATDDPRRGLLMRFFASLKLDLHLLSCIDGRILPIQCAPFKLVDKSKNEDEEAHKLFEKPWFLDLIKLICNHVFEGTKLIEMIELNDKGELNCVTEIPQSNFLPVKGIVVKEEYDTNGVSYKQGAYANYYVQIGNDYTLGMLNELAMIVLAKKLGLGSWMSYIEKFGVPAIFVVTDRMDDGRAKELFKMLQAFRSNHFGILKGSEKVEIPKDTNSDGYQSFDKLNLFCDSQMSKRILGGTGITDEKSFVGAAEIHERQLKYRIQVDKLILKFYMNEEIMPRLVKLSSVYAPLANLTFEWDETETLTLKEKIQAVKDLATSFDFDPEELAKLTGLPIITVKETIKKVEEAQKKKPNASVAGARNYSLAPFAFLSPSHSGEGFGVRSATWDAAISRLADQIWNGEVSPSDLDRDLVLKNYASLNKAAEAAWGDGYYTDEITRKMRDNLMSFAGAKSYNTMSVLNDLRKTVANKESFISEAKLIINKHNETWLNTEAKFAANKTSTAKDFKQYLNDVDIYPNLKVRTMQDENVRETHAANEGVVMPVNNVKYAPPFDPGCRCWLEQTTDPVTKHGLTNINPKWATNPYPGGQLFSDENSYKASILQKDKDDTRNNMELMKQYTPYNHTVTLDNGKKVFINDFADNSDLTQNLVSAKKIAENFDTNVYIRPHTHSSNGIKNPEFGIGAPNAKGDLKTYSDPKKSLEKFITNRISACDDQGCKYAVLDITAYNKEDLNAILKRKLCGELTDKLNKNITDVIVIKGEKISKITRKQVTNRNFDEFSKRLQTTTKLTFEPVKSIDEAIARAKSFGFKHVEFTGAKLDQVNTVLEALHDEHNNIGKINVDRLIIKPGGKSGVGVKGGHFLSKEIYRDSEFYFNSDAFNINFYQPPLPFNDQLTRIKDKIDASERYIKMFEEKIDKYSNDKSFVKRIKKEISTERSKILDYKLATKKIDKAVENGEKPIANTIASLLKNSSDQIKSSVYHEFAHYIDDTLQFPKLKDGASPSVYGSNDRAEYFAEYYAQYKMIGESDIPEDLLNIFKSWKK